MNADRAELRRQLAAINPNSDEFPHGMRWKIAELRLEDFVDHLNRQIAHGFKYKWYQDATFHAIIAFPSGVKSTSALDNAYSSSIRFSNFEKLATIIGLEHIDEEVSEQVIKLMTYFGYTYIPYDVFDEGDDTLFDQLFNHL